MPRDEPGLAINIGINLLCRVPKIEIMCNLHKFVKCCKNLEKTLIQVIHRKKHEKGGKTGVFENLIHIIHIEIPHFGGLFMVNKRTDVLWRNDKNLFLSKKRGWKLDK